MYVTRYEGSVSVSLDSVEKNILSGALFEYAKAMRLKITTAKDVNMIQAYENTARIALDMANKL